MHHEMLSVLSDALFERNLPPVSLQRESQGQEVKSWNADGAETLNHRSAFIFHASWLALAREQ